MVRHRPPRLPRRGVDRLGDLLAWVTAVGAVLLVVGAAAAAGAAYRTVEQRAAVEGAARTAVTAVLVDRVPAPLTPGVIAVPARVRWTGTDGAVHEGVGPVAGPLPAGSPVRIWVDHAGMVVEPPATPGDVGPTAAAVGVVVLAAGGALLAIGRVLAGRALMRRAAVAWAREWRAVEPRWTGRADGRTG